jgi:hypothetical protein
MEQLVNSLGPYAQFVFAIILAFGFVWIQFRNSRKDAAAVADEAVAEKHSEIQTRTDLHFDGPVMATHRMVTDLTGSIGDLRQALALFIETMKLRDQRQADVTADAFRLLRSIDEKADKAAKKAEDAAKAAEGVAKNVESLSRDFDDFLRNQRTRR